MRAQHDVHQAYELERDSALDGEKGSVEQRGFLVHSDGRPIPFHGEDEDIDLDGYEEYLADMKSHLDPRPQSARLLRHVPTESPQFYMVNTNNPSSARPTRPMSARPRMTLSSSRHSLSQPSRTLQHRSGAGLRRKRQGGEMNVSARTRAVYQDVGRTSSGTGPSGMKNMPISVSASSVVHTKLKVFQQAELHDEYFKLVDVVTELKAACQQEQAARVKAMARVRRLEEIMAMKDKKIEALLQKAEHGVNGAGSASSAMAYKERQYHGMIQKLQLKIAQQSQLISSYEDAMQDLRNSIKSTNVMQLEEERNQLYIELRHLHDKVACQRMEQDSQERKIVELQQLDASARQQLAKSQQEQKRTQSEKQKAEQEIALLKSSVDQLQSNVILLQRKRAYDREVANNAHDQRGLTPSRSVLLAQALDELKCAMRKESTTPVASVQRERMKALSTAKSSVSTPRTPKGTPTSNPTPPSAKGQNSTAPTQRTGRPANAGPYRPLRAVTSKPPPAISLPAEHCSQKDDDVHQQDPSELVDDFTTVRGMVGDESKQEPPVQPPEGEGDPSHGKISTEDSASDCMLDIRTETVHESTEQSENGYSNEKARRVASTEFMQTDAEDSKNVEVEISPSESCDKSYANSTEEEEVACGQDTVAELNAVSSLETLQRKEIADIERLLRDMDAAGSGMLDSESSEEFLEDAASQFANLGRLAPTVAADAKECEGEDDDVLSAAEFSHASLPFATLDYEHRYESDFTENNDNDCTGEEDEDADAPL